MEKEINIDDIKKLRELTGAPIIQCKEALKEAGDINKAVILIRQKGLEVAKQKEKKETKHGVIKAYVHSNSKVGALVELGCETDFVSRCDEFNKLAYELAMHITAMAPLSIDKEDLPEKILQEKKASYIEELKLAGKPEKIWDKIIEGKLEKFYKEVCLLWQPFIKNEELTVKEYIATFINKLRENIVVKRFVRYQIE